MSTEAFIRWRFGDVAAGVAMEPELRSRAEAGDLAAVAPLALLLGARNHPETARWVALGLARGLPLPRELIPFEPLLAGPPTACWGTRTRISEGRESPLSDTPPDHGAFLYARHPTPPLDAWVSEERAALFAVWAERGVAVLDLPRGAVMALGEVPEDAPGELPEVEVDGPAVLIDDAFPAFNLCHLLFDKLPRLAVYQTLYSGRRLTAVMATRHPVARAAVEAMGAQPLNLADASSARIRSTGAALLSNHQRGHVLHPGFGAAPWAVRFIAERLQSRRSTGRRLWISRADAGTRRLINEAELAPVLARHGFETITLTGLDFEAQRNLFGQADWLAGVHGAGLAGLAFMAPGGRVSEIMPPLAGTHAYWRMAGALGHAYQLIVAEDAELQVLPGASFDPSLAGRDLRLRPERLDRALSD